MIRKLINPFQVVLLRRRLCPGCTHPLDKCAREPFSENKAILKCKCRRKYILNLDTNTYRRATIEEEKEHLNKIEINK